MARKPSVTISRVYDEPGAGNGVRVLVDRVWPRGVTKEKAAADHWLKEVAPSTALRKWFGHDPERWTEFRRSYRTELDGNKQAVDELLEIARREPVTLLYSARDQERNQAVVLAEYVRERLGKD